MKKIDTLKKNYEFNNVLKSGKYCVKKHIIVYIKPNKKQKNIIGIAVNTHLCGAVGRNRIKRLIRESYYSVKENLKKGNDIVILWNKKTPIEYDCFFEIQKELIDAFKESDLL